MFVGWQNVLKLIDDLILHCFLRFLIWFCRKFFKFINRSILFHSLLKFNSQNSVEKYIRLRSRSRSFWTSRIDQSIPPSPASFVEFHWTTHTYLCLDVIYERSLMSLCICAKLCGIIKRSLLYVRIKCVLLLNKTHMYDFLVLSRIFKQNIPQFKELQSTYPQYI